VPCWTLRFGQEVAGGRFIEMLHPYLPQLVYRCASLLNPPLYLQIVTLIKVSVPCPHCKLRKLSHIRLTCLFIVVILNFIVECACVPQD
jgi:hypothetical protein